MAKLPALITALTEVDGRERAVIENFGRRLREAGAIPRGKRGSGAADVDFRTAANMLIALNTSDTAKDAHRDVINIRSLKMIAPLRPDSPVPLFYRIECARDFGEALERLIEGIPELLDMIFSAIDKAVPDPEREAARLALLLPPPDRSTPFRLEVEMTRYRARISYYDSEPHMTAIRCSIQRIGSSRGEVSTPNRLPTGASFHVLDCQPSLPSHDAF